MNNTTASAIAAAWLAGYDAARAECEDEVRQLTARLAAAEADAARLAKAAAAMPDYSLDSVVACSGLKCREMNCESCFGEESARDAVDTSREARYALRLAIDAARATVTP